MSYDNPIVTEIYGDGFGTWATSASVTMTVIGPKGCVGFVRDLIAEVTASLASVTPCEMCVGTSSGDTTYGRHRLGTSTGATGYAAGVHRASQKAWTGNPPRTLSDFAGHVELEKARIPADTAITLTGVGVAGAGSARIRFVIDWIGGPVA